MESGCVYGERVQVLECDACGAHRSVRSRKTSSTTPASDVRVGNRLDVMIQDIGRKGDGVARVDSYMIIVPGVAKGMSVHVEIDKLVGNTAFAHIVQKD